MLPSWVNDVTLQSSNERFAKVLVQPFETPDVVLGVLYV